jgi:hypothetical protein
MREPPGTAGPKTYGELRRLLAELGNPWEPDPTISDDQPLPEYPTGGDGRTEPIGTVIPQDGVIEFLKGDPPSNLQLRDVWREENLLADSDGDDPPSRPTNGNGERFPRTGG